MDTYESDFIVSNPLLGADGFRSNSPTVSYAAMGMYKMGWSTKFESAFDKFLSF